MLAGQIPAVPPPPDPSFSVAPSSASVFGGFCSGGSVGFPAKLRVSWTAINFNAALHEFRVYQDSILVNTTSSSSWDKDVVGYILDGFFHPVFFSWLFRVDIVRKSDGVVLASGSTTWSHYYGTCS